MKLGDGALAVEALDDVAFWAGLPQGRYLYQLPRKKAAIFPKDD